MKKKKDNVMICEVELEESFNLSESINVYTDGNKVTYLSDSKEYLTILDGWNELMKCGYYMPALGVSLNNLTLEAMKNGLWVEFEYGKTYESYGMYYDKLLININKADGGFNLIRYTKDYGYDGRCFYYNLNKSTTSQFYTILTNL